MEKVGWLLVASVLFCSRLSQSLPTSSLETSKRGAADTNGLTSSKRAAAEDGQVGRMLPVRIENEGGKRGKLPTDEILRHIGMTKEKTLQANNHRKRVAAHSRKSHNEKHLQDSHIYVIKLPPNKFYYDDDKSPAPRGQGLNRIDLDFKSNGKPGKIYHWNLPLVKKMIARKTGQDKIRDANQVLKEGPIWPKEESPLHYRRVTYFKPKKPSKQAFHKYFSGNGRLDSLYLIHTDKKAHKRH